MAKMINGSYHVADCEHRGDIMGAENLLRNNGCIVTNSYWDGRDCGEAYVEFQCRESDFPTLYRKFGISATFNANINDYVQSEGLQGYKRMNRKELYAMKKEMDNDLSAGFENRLALLLWFEVKERKVFTTENIVMICLSYLKDVEVLGYETHITDGCDYISILIKSSYKNLTESGVGAISDYCLGSRGFLKQNHIYGECSCDHVFLSKHNLWDYELLQRVVEIIHNRQDMEYITHADYVWAKKRTMTANDYLTENGTLRNRITIGNDTYKLRDPRSWVKANPTL